MSLGAGSTGTIVSLIVAMSSGVAFAICFREFVREVFSVSVPRFDKKLRRSRNVLFDEGSEFVVDDEVFNQLLQAQKLAHFAHKGREWRDPTTYILTVGFLGLVAAAGFIAGLSHFT